MQKSTNYGFNLPSRDSDDLADVNSLSENFIEIDEILYSTAQELDNKPNGTKVTEITEDSTDQQIPSAKAVNDALSNHEIDVDSELSATSENPVKNKVLSNSVANALKGSASGNPVVLPDVSTLEHEMKVKLSGFSVEEIFKYDGNSGNDGVFLYTDITESGVYVVESVTYDEDGDSTYITFEGGITAETSWLDGEPFAVGDVVFVKVDGNKYSFSIMHGATVQKHGKNLFNYKDFVAYANSVLSGNYAIETTTHLGEECFSFRNARNYGNTDAFTKIAFKEKTPYTFSFSATFTFKSVQPKPSRIGFKYFTAFRALEPWGKSSSFTSLVSVFSTAF
jgi:hypothetical protein